MKAALMPKSTVDLKLYNINVNNQITKARLFKLSVVNISFYSTGTD